MRKASRAAIVAIALVLAAGALIYFERRPDSSTAIDTSWPFTSGSTLTSVVRTTPTIVAGDPERRSE